MHGVTTRVFGVIKRWDGFLTAIYVSRHSSDLLYIRYREWPHHIMWTLAVQV
jgi:hypothetical protein